MIKTIEVVKVEKIEDTNMETLLNDMRNEVAMLMRAVAPNCKRMTLACRLDIKCELIAMTQPFLDGMGSSGIVQKCSK